LNVYFELHITFKNKLLTPFKMITDVNTRLEQFDQLCRMSTSKPLAPFIFILSIPFASRFRRKVFYILHTVWLSLCVYTMICGDQGSTTWLWRYYIPRLPSIFVKTNKYFLESSVSSHKLIKLPSMLHLCKLIMFVFIFLIFILDFSALLPMFPMSVVLLSEGGEHRNLRMRIWLYVTRWRHTLV